MTDIAERRADLLISQTDFGAIAAGVKQTSVSRWERGKHVDQSDLLDNVLDAAEAKRRELTRFIHKDRPRFAVTESDYRERFPAYCALIPYSLYRIIHNAVHDMTT